MTDKKSKRLSVLLRTFMPAFFSIFFQVVCVLVVSAEKCEPKNVAYALQNSGYIVIEQSGGRVLYGEGQDNFVYPASTTKILTALTVIESLPTDKIITVPRAAVGVEGSSIYLKEGEKISVEALLYGLMLRSGNDAAVTLALAVSGDIPTFAALMNAKAAQCGAKNSNFVNPHGLHNDNHYTTARDLALITAKAMNSPVFAKIVSTKIINFHCDEERTHCFVNKNKMLKTYEGANGVKTGFTKKSGRCLVSSAKRDGMQLICVTLNCPDMWQKSKTLLDNAFSTYFMQPLETALIPLENVGDANPTIRHEIDVHASYGERGEFVPRSYPIKRDGSEILNVKID